MENLDDDDVKLPADTLAILSQFMKEQETQKKEDLFAENWNLSQFWWVCLREIFCVVSKNAKILFILGILKKRKKNSAKLLRIC